MYKMVTQNLLRTLEGGKAFLEMKIQFEIALRT